MVPNSKASGSGHPLTRDGKYDKHRFDNPSAWLDREDRKMARQPGALLAYGYSRPRPQPPPRAERPFHCQEYSFTSGQLINRRYDLNAGTDYATETTRSDPWHYPNSLETKDEDHFQDRRRKPQNLDAFKPDSAMDAAIPDHLLKHELAAHRNEVRANIDPKKLESFFERDVRPNPETLHELNVDLSCIDLPTREGGSLPNTKRTASKLNSKRTCAAASPSSTSVDTGRHGVSSEDHAADKWRWCLGGRPITGPEVSSVNDMQITRSQSLPQIFGTTSTLSGNLGGAAVPFHGVHTRKFGIGQNDLRMRGGKHAREGFAGTYPAKEASFR